MAGDSWNRSRDLVLIVRAPGPEPGRFFVAPAVGREHAEIAACRVIQIDHTVCLRRHRANIPATGVHSHYLAGSLKGSRFGQVPFPFGAAAETQKLAIRRPIDVVNLIGLVFDVQTPLAHRRRFCVQADRRRRDFMVARSPGNLLSIRAEARPAARDFQIDDPGTVSLDQKDGVVDAHPGVHC